MGFSRIFLPRNKTNSFFGSKMGGGLIHWIKLYTGKYGYCDASFNWFASNFMQFWIYLYPYLQYISWFIPPLVDLHFIWRFGILHLIFSTKEWSWRTKKEDRKRSDLIISYAECYTHIGKLQDSNGMEMRRRANNSRGGGRDTKSCYLTFRGVNFRFRFHLRCSGQKVIANAYFTLPTLDSFATPSAEKSVW